ncbi:putative membrane protein [Microbacterium resistens]|uniref:Membrane protein n=1 Tax=Microbacterium resistens TaxID=156977 RepID=A0ABU1SEY4_9MICO|nr:hypothetical protein [Microbacterium resistens]MDR6868166.1 putative membrane protein [Microbacterium resistens]
MSELTTPPAKKPNTSLLLRGAIWIAIGALIAAALVCVIWVLVGDQQELVGRAFLTILLLAAFAGIAILEASLSSDRPDWLALLSIISWIIALLVGAVKIWLPADVVDYDGERVVEGGARFFQFLLVVIVLQLAVLHVRIFWRASQRYVTTFTRVVTFVTFAFLGLLVALLVFFLTFPETFHYSDLFWRIVVALTILTAVGSTLIPLLNALFAPKRPAAALPAVRAWPTYVDGTTPLPVLRDGSPDWNAYYTGVPSVEAPIPTAYGAVLPPVPEAPPIPSNPGGWAAPSTPPATSAPSTPLAEPVLPSEPVFPIEPVLPPRPPAPERAPDAAAPDTAAQDVAPPEFPAAPPAAPAPPQS